MAGQTDYQELRRHMARAMAARAGYSAAKLAKELAELRQLAKAEFPAALTEDPADFLAAKFELARKIVRSNSKGRKEREDSAQLNQRSVPFRKYTRLAVALPKDEMAKAPEKDRLNFATEYPIASRQRNTDKAAGRLVLLWGDDVRGKPTQLMELQARFLKPRAGEFQRSRDKLFNAIERARFQPLSLAQLRSAIGAHRDAKTAWLTRWLVADHPGSAWSTFSPRDKVSASELCIRTDVANVIRCFFLRNELLHAWTRDAWYIVAPGQAAVFEPRPK